MKSDIIDIDLMVLHETEAAVMVTDSFPESAVWLPKSQIEIGPSDSNIHTIILPEWLAVEKELI